MAWRKWIVRGVVYGIIGACVLGALGYQSWTNPGAVREQIIAKLGEIFPGAEVSVDWARLRIFGGIELGGLRLMRKDDPEKNEFLFVPSAIFYHDKEKILDGELTLRKIELHHPRLRVRRERDGKWNLQGVYNGKRTPPDTLAPTIVINQGTLIFEDRLDVAKAATLEVNDISMTLINDPLPTVIVRGAANSDWLGKLQFKGHVNRLDDEVYLTFNATRIPLTHGLLARFPSQCPGKFLNGLELSATASVRGKVSYHPRQTQPWYYDVRCEVDQGTVKHPRLPLPFLDNVRAKIHCDNGALHLETLTARCDKTEVEAHAQALLPCPENEFEAQLELKHVMLGADLAGRLPDKIRELHTLFQPKGPTTIHIDIARHEGQFVSLSTGVPSQVSLRPEGVSLKFKEFAYQLERAEGAIDFNILTEKVEVRLTAYAGDRMVRLRGDWIGEGRDADVWFDVNATDITIDEKLLRALPIRPINLQQFAESFRAAGKINVNAHISHKPGDKDFRNEFHLFFHDVAMRWDNFPYALTNVSGSLDIYPEHWEFHQFQGTHKDGHVLVHGKSIPRPDAKGENSHGISLEITGQNVDLDDDLREALKPMKDLHNAWKTFAPEGRLYFTASIERPNDDIRKLDVRVDAHGCSVRPHFFPYRIQNVAGQFRFHNFNLEISKLRARHGQAIINMDQGTVELEDGGGYRADLSDVRIQGMRLDDEFIGALPDKQGMNLQKAARSLRLTDPFAVQSRVVIKQPAETGRPPDVWWDGQLWMYDARLSLGLEVSHATGTIACVGRHNGRQMEGLQGHFILNQASVCNQPFKNVNANFLIAKESPDVLQIGLHAPIFAGDITGQVRVDIKSTPGYELNLTASQIDVAEFGRHNLGAKSQLSGVASARLSLKGLATDRPLDTLDGRGSIAIPRGHFYNLPLLLDLLKLLGSDRTVFEEVNADFIVQGPQVTVRRFDLLGSAISLSGKGDYDLHSKKLEMDIYPTWGRVEQLLPPSWRLLPTAVSKNLLIVEVRGKAGPDGKDLKMQMKPLPAFTVPLQNVRDRIVRQNDVNQTATKE